VGNEKLLDDLAIDEQWQDAMMDLQKAAKTVVVVALDNRVIGLIAIQDAPKPTSKAAIAELKAQGLQPVMLTGDNHVVAKAIARQ
ncbi:HAD family hydrolase, partial [Bacillus velezensis]